VHKRSIKIQRAPYCIKDKVAQNGQAVPLITPTTLQPVLDHYAVGFRVMHGFSSATAIYDVSQDDDGRDLIALYVGDFRSVRPVYVGRRFAQAARRV
jgi:hypothetical protein